MRVLTLIAVLLLTACQPKSEPVGLTVDLQSTVDEATVNELLQFIAVVKYDNEQVVDGVTVEFEVVENGVSYGNLPIQPNEAGEYTLELKFTEPGEHKVISHVTYEDVHEMPEVIVDVTAQ